jgi:hypothetical protein
MYVPHASSRSEAGVEQELKQELSRSQAGVKQELKQELSKSLTSAKSGTIL